MTEEHIKARQIDIVNADGVSRLTLTAGDDLEGKRIASFGGVIIRDARGGERGGIGVLDVEGNTRVVTALDHPTYDAIGTMVNDDGEVMWIANQVPDAPGEPARNRVKMRIAPDGTPSFALCDEQERPRLRLTLTDSGAGAIEFLRADGSVAQRIVPEEE